MNKVYRVESFFKMYNCICVQGTVPTCTRYMYVDDYCIYMYNL